VVIYNNVFVNIFHYSAMKPRVGSSASEIGSTILHRATADDGGDDDDDDDDNDDYGDDDGDNTLV
jgi:hypothetical protein